MDKIVLDHDKLLGFDHPSNLRAKVGAKPATIVADKAKARGDQPQAKPELSRGRSRAGDR